MHTVSRFSNIARTVIQQSSCEQLIGMRFASRKRREDCLDEKKVTEKKEEKKEIRKEECVDLNFKKKEYNIYDYNDCLPPQIPLNKDCSTVKAKKVSCTTKKRHIPTGCRKYSMYSRVQRSFNTAGNTYREAGFPDKKMFTIDDTQDLYRTKHRCVTCDRTAHIQKSCNAPSIYEPRKTSSRQFSEK